MAQQLAVGHGALVSAISTQLFSDRPGEEAYAMGGLTVQDLTSSPLSNEPVDITDGP